MYLSIFYLIYTYGTVCLNQFTLFSPLNFTNNIILKWAFQSLLTWSVFIIRKKIDSMTGNSTTSVGPEDFIILTFPLHVL